MGKIMRNGNKYSSASPNNAQSVVYDNTDSGLNAENTKEAIDELNKNLDNLDKKIDSEINALDKKKIGYIASQISLSPNTPTSYNISGGTFLVATANAYNQNFVAIVCTGTAATNTVTMLHSSNKYNVTCSNGVLTVTPTDVAGHMNIIRLA